MNHVLAVATVLLCTAVPSSDSFAQGDNLASRSLAANCANCHGTNGKSAGGIPSLAGQSRANIARAMRDFRDGRRPATIMHQLARGYTEEQIDLLAGFFAAQK